MTSPLKTLAQNIQVNCTDTTNFSSLPTIKGAYIMSEFALLSSKGDYYAIIVLGPPEVGGNLITEVRQPVTVSLCYRGDKEPTGESAVEKLLVDRLELREALNRSDPYGNGKPSSS